MSEETGSTDATVVETKEVKEGTETVTSMTLEEIENDPICKRWMTFNLTEPKTEDHKKVEKYYDEKQKFWNENEAHLKKCGLRHSTGLATALDFLETEKHDAESCLFVLKIGSNERPASAEDLEMVRKMADEALNGVVGYHIIVTGHDLNIERIPLRKLRQLESKLLNTETEGSSASIMRDMEL